MSDLWNTLITVVIGLGVLVLALVALWIVFLVIFWALRPKGVSVRELVGLIPDILRLLRSLIVDRSAPLDVRLVVVGENVTASMCAAEGAIEFPGQMEF